MVCGREEPQWSSVLPEPAGQESNSSANQSEGKSPDIGLNLVGLGSNSYKDARHSTRAESNQKSTSEADSPDRSAGPIATRGLTGEPLDKDRYVTDGVMRTLHGKR